MLKKPAFFASFLILCALGAEEGMWPFHSIPVDRIKEQYDVALEKQWLDHVQKSCVRISSGGSGSFVSANGLILTNHHVGESAIYNLSTPDHDLVKEGFLAKRQKEEIPCPNLYVDRLMEIRDVTEEVNLALSGETPEEKEKQRDRIYAELKKKAQEDTGLQPEIVTLYQGARIHLYLYERFSDVRLVMAPEKALAFFGGDLENFEYPRTALDFCFFRVYKNNKPLKTPYYLKWSRKGPQLNEPLFVVGHPGKTSRMLTSAHLRFLKQYEFTPLRRWMTELRNALLSFAEQGEEEKRIALSPLGSLENTLKATRTFTDAGLDPIIKEKANQEAFLEQASLLRLQKVLIEAQNYWISYLHLEGRRISKLYSLARHFVRLSEELEKPNELRLREYNDSELSTLKLTLLSDEPIYKNLDRILLNTSLQQITQDLGSDHPVTLLLKKQNLDELMQKTRLDLLEVRKEFYEHPEQVKESQDPLILLAKAIDPYARKLRQQKEESFDSVRNEVYTSLAQAAFAKWGESIYPDATFTLRLSYGTMKSYEEAGTVLSPMTRFQDLFAHAKYHQFKQPYELPKRWLKKNLKLDLTVPLNFVSTNDIIGGNSGSPVINKNQELVGLIFDGNSYSNNWYFRYDDLQGRAISVHSQAILKALQDVYKANALARELTR